MQTRQDRLEATGWGAGAAVNSNVGSFFMGWPLIAQPNEPKGNKPGTTQGPENGCGLGRGGDARVDAKGRGAGWQLVAAQGTLGCFWLDFLCSWCFQSTGVHQPSGGHSATLLSLACSPSLVD